MPFSPQCNTLRYLLILYIKKYVRIFYNISINRRVKAWNFPFSALSTGYSLQLEVWPLVLLWNILRISTEVPILKNWGLLWSKEKEQPGVGSQVSSVNRKLLFKSPWTPLCCQCSTRAKQATFSCASFKSAAAFKKHLVYQLTLSYVLCICFLNPTNKLRSHTQHRLVPDVPHSHHRPGRGISFSVVSFRTKTMLLAGSQLDTETLWNDSRAETRPLAWARHSSRNPLWSWWY